MPHPSTSSAYGIWSLNEVRDAERGDNWPPLIVVWTADLTNASYDSVSDNVSSQDSTPHSIRFNNDGTKMYIVGQTNDSVFQYSLSTEFDVSTASYDSVSFSVSSQENQPSGVTFNNDGTKMYVVGYNNDSVFQYSLSTGFDLSTASYDSVSLNVSSQMPFPAEVIFNNDGTKMYVAGAGNTTIFQYSLSPGFDLSTASYDSVSFSVSSQDTNIQAVAFNNGGTKMYVNGTANDSIFQYSLSTAFDVSTASYDSVSFSHASQETVARGLTFSSNGTKMYIVGDNGIVYQYSTGL